jgi:hydroxyethylthiazole kinase-like uncharacterized protein yjeF
VSRSGEVIGTRVLRRMPLPGYDAEADKDDRGKLLIVAGSAGLPGGAILPARAALRIGCGTVRVALPSAIATAVGVAVPELMVVPLPPGGEAIDVLASQLEACAAVVAGPGMLADPATDELLAWLIEHAECATLIDARGLHVWAGRPCWELAGPRVLTPHGREVASMLGREVTEGERASVASAFARQYGGTFVLKGAETLIADRAGGLFRNRRGTRGLGTAGSGDVLAGVIGGLLAQGLGPTEAAVWGVHVHALAGEAVAEQLGEDGMIASDLLPRLPVVLGELRRRVGRSERRAR